MKRDVRDAVPYGNIGNVYFITVASDALVAHKNVTDISINNSGNRFIQTIRFFHSICPSRHSTKLSFISQIPTENKAYLKDNKIYIQ